MADRSAELRLNDLEVRLEDSEEPGAFAVVPLTDCPHLHQLGPAPAQLSIQAPCKECGVEGENWVCLCCYEVSGALDSGRLREWSSTRNMNSDGSVLTSFGSIIQGFEGVFLCAF